MKKPARLIVVLAATLVVMTLLLLPRIIEAKRSKSVTPDKSRSVTPSLTVIPRQDQNGQIIVGASVRNDISPPLRDMKPVPVQARPEREANENPRIPHHHVDAPDTVIQNFHTLAGMITPQMPATILNFDGIPFPGVACNCAPPDTDGEVGQTQYVQIVNEGYQVFNKTTGASILGPLGISTIWSGFGGACQNFGFGDPVVLYDQLANRWVVTQFASATGGLPITDECIAVSTTNDATGSYARYGFHLGSNFFDYPKLGVWPDGYYMSMNVFNSSGTAFLGPQAFAFDRAAMLAGAPATFVTPGITGGPSEDSFNPADLDGSTLPAAGAPASFVEWPGTGVYKIWHFHADFVTPAMSTFTLFASPAAAPFTEICAATRSCVPQLGTTSMLDAIGDRLMHRAAFRIIGGVERLVTNYTVSSGGVAGIRWVELRNLTSGPVTVFQEATYQPDSTYRWMGSIAQDQLGDMALGYSASSAAINPQIRYVGRLVNDPINTLPQGESHLFDGTGSQVGTSSRWGDYSAMSIDPVDDCTFWYTQEYYSTTSSFNWRTRIGSFKFPDCGSTQTFTLNATPSSVSPGQTINVSWTAPSGRPADDWIGLYRVGDPDSAFIAWQYTGGAPSGSQNYTAPNQAGQYEFRYFTNNTFNRVATSNTVTVSGGTFTLNATPSSVSPGQTINVSWTAPSGRPADDWIGLYRVGDPDSAFIAWQYTGGAPSGSQNYTAPNQAGNYEFRYFTHNTFTRVATSNTVTVGSSGMFSLNASPSSVTPGQTITVAFTAPSGRPADDWIGLYRVGDPDTAYIAWQYTGGATSGSQNYTAPNQTGNYEFRYFTNNSFTKVATSNTVIVSAGTFTLSASPSSVSPGQTINVSWTAPSGRPADDWIGLYRVGVPDTSFIAWQYTGGAPSGSQNYTAPSQTGNYEFRYFTNNTFNRVATSNTVSVGP